MYSKAVPTATFADIEKKMRQENFEVFLVALVSVHWGPVFSYLIANLRKTKEKEVGDCLILIDLQGKLSCKYVVGFYFSEKPQRANLKDRWPPTPEDNLERLADAGFPYDRHIPKCANCGGKCRGRYC
jgi:hypothetical protein